MSTMPVMAGVAEAAARSGLAVYRVRCLCAEGAVQSIRCGRRILVNLDSLADFLNGSSTPAAADEADGIRRIN